MTLSAKSIINKKNHWIPEVLIFGFAFITRFFRLGIPNTYMFDEVYHAFTAEQMFKGNPAAWEWWNPNPTGFAYEWTHPPVAKEFMVLAIRIFGDNPFAWRFFSAFFGFGVIILIYFLALKLFKNRFIALVSAFLCSLDGLLLVMSRIAMNDMYFLFFVLLAFLFFLYNKKFWMGLCLGLSVASKWTGLFGIGILGIVYLVQIILGTRKKKIDVKNILKKIIIAPAFFLLIPLIVYLISYVPFFAGHHSPPGTNQSTFQTFIQLQGEMYWYHTHLVAHHEYQSVPIQWVFNIRPVWFYVNYVNSTTIANIYALGNPIFQWTSLIAIIFLIYKFIKKRSFALGFVILSYFGFFILWVHSPRIMFYYHYLPSVPFLGIALAYALSKIVKTKAGPAIVALFLIIVTGAFFYFLPLWTAIPVSKCLNTQNCISVYDSYFWLPSWK